MILLIFIALLLVSCSEPLSQSDDKTDTDIIEDILGEEQISLKQTLVALPDGRMMDGMGGMGDMSCCSKDGGMMNCCSCCKMKCHDATSDSMSCCDKDGGMGDMGCGSHDMTGDMDMASPLRMSGMDGGMGDMTGDTGHVCACCEGMEKQYGYIKKISVTSITRNEISFFIFIPVTLENDELVVGLPQILFNKEGVSEGFDDYNYTYVKVKGKAQTGVITGIDREIEGLYGHCVKEQTPPWE